MTIEYLTGPQAEKTQPTYYYKCELASKELELDSHGIPVPKDVKTVELVVIEANQETAIASLIAFCWLSGYKERESLDSL